MIYISYGVPKSASTYTYMVTEQVLKVAGYAPVALSEAAKGRKSRLNYVDPISGAALERVVSEIGTKSAVIKTHGAPDERVMQAVERGEVFASAVIRDPREIALSLLDHAKRSRSLGVRDFVEFETVTDTFKLLDDQLNRRLKRWMESSKVLLLTYDEISFGTEFVVQRIIDQLGISVQVADVISALPARQGVEQFNKGIRNRFESEMPAETQQIFLERYADVYRRYLRPEAIQNVHGPGLVASIEPPAAGQAPFVTTTAVSGASVPKDLPDSDPATTAPNSGRG